MRRLGWVRWAKSLISSITSKIKQVRQKTVLEKRIVFGKRIVFVKNKIRNLNRQKHENKGRMF